MHKNTYLLVSILAVVAALVIGVNIGRQVKVPKTMPSQLDIFFSPKSVAVIGASRTPGKMGYMILENLKMSQ